MQEALPTYFNESLRQYLPVFVPLLVAAARGLDTGLTLMDPDNKDKKGPNTSLEILGSASFGAIYAAMLTIASYPLSQPGFAEGLAQRSAQIASVCAVVHFAAQGLAMFSEVMSASRRNEADKSVTSQDQAQDKE